MRIAFFADSYLPYISGVTVSIHTLLHGLRERGHEVILFAPHYPHHGEEEPFIYRVPSVRWTYPGFRLAIPAYRRVRKVLLEHPVDLIHTHSPDQMGQLAKRLAKEFHIPLIYTMHTFFDQYLHHIPWPGRPLARIFLKRFLQSFCHAASVVIVPSESARRFLENWGVASPIVVASTGVPLQRIEHASAATVRARHKIPEESPLLLYAGRLAQEKNVPLLLRAFQKVHHLLPKAFLLLAGKGPDTRGYQRLTRELGLTQSVVFAGEIHRETRDGGPSLFSYYKAATLFVSPSHTETQGLSLVEAMAAGLPGVVVRSPATSEILEDGKEGYIVPSDPISFSKVILGLLQNPPLLSKMGLAAKKRAYDFREEVFVEKVETVYREAVR